MSNRWWEELSRLGHRELVAWGDRGKMCATCGYFFLLQKSSTGKREGVMAERLPDVNQPWISIRIMNFDSSGAVKILPAARGYVCARLEIME